MRSLRKHSVALVVMTVAAAVLGTPTLGSATPALTRGALGTPPPSTPLRQLTTTSGLHLHLLPAHGGARTSLSRPSSTIHHSGAATCVNDDCAPSGARLVDGGGQIITATPTVYFVQFTSPGTPAATGPYATGVGAAAPTPNVTSSLAATMTTSYLNQLDQYGRGQPFSGSSYSFGGYLSISDSYLAGTHTAAGGLWANQIDTELGKLEEAGMLPPVSLGSIFVLFFRADQVLQVTDPLTSQVLTSTTDFCGYHSSQLAHRNLHYIAMPNEDGNPPCSFATNPGATNFDNTTLTLSHEIAETLTDPQADGSGWFDAANLDEVSDECENGNQPSGTVAGYQLSNLWSNQVGACLTGQVTSSLQASATGPLSISATLSASGTTPATTPYTAPLWRAPIRVTSGAALLTTAKTNTSGQVSLNIPKGCYTAPLTISYLATPSASGSSLQIAPTISLQSPVGSLYAGQAFLVTAQTNPPACGTVLSLSDGSTSFPSTTNAAGVASFIVTEPTSGAISLTATGTVADAATTSSALGASITDTSSGVIPVSPARLLDTRAGYRTIDSQFSGTGAYGEGEARSLVVTGRGGVPASGVAAVFVNVTAVTPSADGYLTIFPTGSSMPNASSLNFSAGETIPNLVLAKVGTNGSISIFNFAGATDIVVDVVGWVPTSSGVIPVSPARLLDTRVGWPTIDGQFSGTGAYGSGETRSLVVTGRGGVPASGVAAVFVNVTAVTPSADGYLTIFPTGSSMPNASSLNFSEGRTIPNLVLAKVGMNGGISIFNFTGTTDVIVDVVGWVPSASSAVPVSPARLLDTRVGWPTIDGQFSGTGPIGSGGVLALPVTGRVNSNVPSSGVGAVFVNVTAVTPSDASFLSIFPRGTALPNASNLNFTAGQNIANLVLAKVGTNGKISLFNYYGSTQVLVDVVGWVP